MPNLSVFSLHSDLSHVLINAVCSLLKSWRDFVIALPLAASLSLVSRETEIQKLSILGDNTEIQRAPSTAEASGKQICFSQHPQEK